MESWNQVIHTALLGTDKRTLNTEDIGAELADSVALIAQYTQGKEEAFLQTAALLYNYRQCGFLPLHGETVSMPAAAEEEKEYAIPAAHFALADIMESGSISLLQFWLERCAGAGKIVQPEIIPLLLDAGMKHQSLQEGILSCCGKRGVWLMSFNDAWKYSEPAGEEELWQTGTLEQRKQLLARIRQTDPAKARAWLQQAWSQENAAARAELLRQLTGNAGEEDLPWLEELLKEKSARVRDEVIAILKRIPSSSIVQLYWKLLEPSIEVRKEKTLLGLSSKTVMDIFPVKQVDDLIYKTGIERVSSEKNVSDHIFLLYQLIMSVPPSFFELHTGLGKEEILKSLQHSDQGKNFLPAFGQAAVQFREADWLRAVISFQDTQLYEEAFRLLPQDEAEKYALKHLEGGPNATVMEALSGFSREWGLELTRAVLEGAAKNPYQYNKAFYNVVAHLLPSSVAGELEKFTPKEEYLKAMWGNLSDHIRQLLQLKQQTIKVFNL